MAHASSVRYRSLILIAAATTLLLSGNAAAHAGTASEEFTPTPSPSPEIAQGISAVVAGNAEAGGTVTNNVSQQNIVMFGSPTPEPTPTPPIIPSDFISLNISDGRSIVQPGGVLTYRIVFRNTLDYELSDITVVAHIPQFLVPLEITPSDGTANSTERTITWSNQTIAAHTEIVFIIKAQVEHHAPHGIVLHTVAEAAGPNLHLSAEDTTTVEAFVPTIAGAEEQYPAQTLSVPITAQTGLGAPMLLSLLAISITGGVAGIRYALLQ